MDFVWSWWQIALWFLFLGALLVLILLGVARVARRLGRRDGERF
ncbi:MAG TPA: hypothetical protein VK926_08785 [Gaiellaceae bacterium]|nr:hypothetical protein [Gaiellaceae bacterium]